MHQVDLEDLIELCNSKRAKIHLREAVDCYKVGAYRACVINTWISVVYDIIDKLRDLGLSGNAEANAKVREFEDINARRDLQAALNFEGDVLSLAIEPFEFLTEHEAIEVRRLQEDRNRCAHPNLVREEEVFLPTAEQARVHMRHAVEFVVQRPPDQGKSPLQFLQREVESQYFPTTVDGAYEALKVSPIARAKKSLLKTFVFGAITSSIKEGLPVLQIQQRLAAVGAVYRLHPTVVEELLRNGISSVYSQLGDEFLGRAIVVLFRLDFVPPWLAEHIKTKLRTFVQDMPNETCGVELVAALHIDLLSSEAKSKIATLTSAGAHSVVDSCRLNNFDIPPEIIDRLISIYSESASFDTANNNADRLIRPILEKCTSDQIERVVRASSNSQVSGSFRFNLVLQEIKLLRIMDENRFNALLDELDLSA